MIAAYTTLVNNVVAAAIQAGAVEAQIDATHELIDANTKMVEILKYQLAKGYASRIDLAAQEAQLAQTVATLPPLIKQQAQLHDLLAVLAGRYPIQAPEQKFELASLKLPQDVPVSLPSAAGGAAAGRAAGARRTCTTPAPRSASPSPTACPISS